MKFFVALRDWWIRSWGLIRPGQVWKYDISSPNPFLEREYIFYEVLETKQGHVRYKQLNSPRRSENAGLIGVDTCGSFRISATCIFNPKTPDDKYDPKLLQEETES